MPDQLALGKHYFSAGNQVVAKKIVSDNRIQEKSIIHYKRNTPLATHICVARTKNKCCKGLYQRIIYALP